MKTREERRARYVEAEIKRKAKYAAQKAQRVEKSAVADAKWAAAKTDYRVAKAPVAPVPMTEEQKRIHNQLALGMSSSSLADTMRSPIALLLLPTTLSMMRKERKIAKRIRDAETESQP
jgi:uncharacterized protein (DUF1800 family)